MIKALQAGGLLERSDDGLVAIARSTAERFDRALVDPTVREYAVAALGKLHLAVTLAVLGRFPPADQSDGTAEMLSFIRASGPNTWSVGPMGDAIVE